ncbi:MAG: 50S ribosomal protein L11 methyltransferase [Desulfobacteraceae bacterium]|nr:50S ribosomal protein L11 methyltransferase [Desulfobacteraceae bacterium]
MKWLHIKAIFESDNIDLAEELVSDIFFSLGLSGVECNIPIPGSKFNKDIKETSIATYIPDTDSAPELLKKIKSKASALDQSGIKIRIATEAVDEEDWAESWKKFFHVTKITPNIIIKPEWRDYKIENNEVVIELDPGMAFGTGTHPTTALCIKMIEKSLKPDDSFLDVGTGSGILMIAAAKLGASYLLGIDNDEVAVDVAKKNLEKNKINHDEFEIRLNTIEELNENNGKAGFDIICANILAHVIIDILPAIKTILNPGGIAILSGIIKEKEKLVLSSIKENKLELIDIKYQEEWVAIAIKQSTG